jgi:hypothetical protein
MRSRLFTPSITGSEDGAEWMMQQWEGIESPGGLNCGQQTK